MNLREIPPRSPPPPTRDGSLLWAAAFSLAVWIVCFLALLAAFKP